MLYDTALVSRKSPQSGSLVRWCKRI